MSILDLTTSAAQRNWNGALDYELSNRLVHLHSNACQYTGVCHHLDIHSMVGTYIDFPGHIQETDNGLDASNYPIDKLYRQAAHVIHLDRASGSGAVTAEDLRAAAGGDVKTDVLIINALGHKQTREIAQRSVWLTMDAVEWIASTGCHILVSDIFESTALEGVFLKLFERGISTVCEPWDLFKLPNEVRVSIFFLQVPQMKQIPCRIIAEF